MPPGLNRSMIRLRRRKGGTRMNDVDSLDRTRARRFDGVRLAILNKRFENIVRKMANTLLRTGRSGVLNTARDFSCCIVTAATAC